MDKLILQSTARPAVASSESIHLVEGMGGVAQPPPVEGGESQGRVGAAPLEGGYGGT